MAATTPKRMIHKNAKSSTSAVTVLNITGLVPEKRRALCSAVKRALYLSVLAEIKDLQEAFTGDSGTEFRFDPAEANKGERSWDSIDNQIAEDPEKLVTPPVRITPAMCTPLAALFVDVVNLVNATGKLRGDRPLTTLVNATDHDQSAVLRAMLAVTERMAHLMHGGFMSREFGCPDVFEQKLAVLVARRSDVDPGGNALAALFYHFIKCVGWHIAHACWEQKHYVFNEDALHVLLATFEAVVPDDDREALAVLRRRVRSAFAELTAETEDKKSEKAAAAKNPKKISPVARAAVVPGSAPAKAAAREATPPAEPEASKNDAEIDDDAADGHETVAEPGPAPTTASAEKKKTPAIKLAPPPRAPKSNSTTKPAPKLAALRTSEGSTGSELSEVDSSHSTSSNTGKAPKHEAPGAKGSNTSAIPASRGAKSPAPSVPANPRQTSGYSVPQAISYDDLSGDILLDDN